MVLVFGDGPGLGKSTLAREVAAALRARGRPVRLFAEEDFWTAAEFGEVMREFKATGRVARQTLLDAAAAYAATIAAADESVFVLDSLLPYLPSLLAWGWSDAEITEFLDEMAAVLNSFDVVYLHLVGDLDAALSRAEAREGDRWLAQIIRKYGVATRNELLAQFSAEAARAATILDGAPWPVVFINADAGARHAMDEAVRAVTTSV